MLDYDDLLLYWAAMMTRWPAIAPSIGQRFDHVLVDEYQDTNRLQAVDPAGAEARRRRADRRRRRRAVDLFVPRRHGAQHPRFPGDFTPAADIVTLDRNYRSTQPILDAANAVIARGQERFTKNLWTERQSTEKPQLVTVRDEADQANYVVERVLEEPRGRRRSKQQAVLFRTVEPFRPRSRSSSRGATSPS